MSLKQSLKNIYHSRQYRMQLFTDGDFPAAELEKKKKYYSGLVEDLCAEIRKYRPDNSLYESKELFKDFRIVSYNGDRMGKVLTQNGEFYRGVYPEASEDLRELWKTGILQVLGEKGMIPETHITKYYTDEYPIILHHKKVQMSVSLMWTYSMVRDAAIMMSVIGDVLANFGYKLHDGHLNNMTFHDGKPMFTDIGSIVKDNGQKTSFKRELVFSACYRMMFEQLGSTALARVQVYDENNNSVWIQPRLYNDQMREYRLLLKEYYAGLRAKGCRRKLGLAKKIFGEYDVRPENIDLLFSKLTIARMEGFTPAVDPLVPATVHNLPGVNSVLMLSNAGEETIHDMYTANRRMSVAHFDEALAEADYEFIKSKRINANVYLFSYMYASSVEARETLRSDAVVAMDITHCTGTIQRYKADSLVNSLRKLTSRFAVITYYPAGKHNEKYECPMQEDGSEDVDSLIKAFKREFCMYSLEEITHPKDGTKGYLLIGELYGEKAK